MKRPLAYITAAWYGGDTENAELAAQYCRAVYDAGFAPICPALFLPLFLNDAVPEEHKSSIDIGRDLLRRSRVLVVCGHTVTESMKNDIAVAQRLGITATTLEGILTWPRCSRRTLPTSGNTTRECWPGSRFRSPPAPRRYRRS